MVLMRRALLLLSFFPSVLTALFLVTGDLSSLDVEISPVLYTAAGVDWRGLVSAVVVSAACLWLGFFFSGLLKELEHGGEHRAR